MSVAQSANAGRSSTSSSLLDRVRARDQEAWGTLVKLYAPLVYGECRRMGVCKQDAPDIVQEVFRKVAGGLANFRHDRPGDSFRAWLATIARNCIRDYFKLHADRPVAVGGSDMHRIVQELPDIDAMESTLTTSPGSTVNVVREAMGHVRSEFEEQTWAAFWRTAVDSAAPADVAAQLGVTKWVVYQAKSRVLRRLRRELEGLLE